MELELWIMPLHVAPVVSYDALKKGRIERPRSGLDRFNLTDIGDALLVPYISSGGKVKFEKVTLPYPWKLELGDRTVLETIRAGNSTFRSVMRIRFNVENGFSGTIKKMLEGLGRDPLDTPYWDLRSWEAFHKESGKTRDQLASIDAKVMEALHIQPGLGE